MKNTKKSRVSASSTLLAIFLAAPCASTQVKDLAGGCESVVVVAVSQPRIGRTLSFARTPTWPWGCQMGGTTVLGLNLLAPPFPLTGSTGGAPIVAHWGKACYLRVFPHLYPVLYKLGLYGVDWIDLPNDRRMLGLTFYLQTTCFRRHTNPKRSGISNVLRIRIIAKKGRCCTVQDKGRRAPLSPLSRSNRA